MKWKWYLLVGVAALGLAGSHLALRGHPPGKVGRGPGAPSQRPDHVAANGVVEGARPEVAVRPEIIGTIADIPFRENGEVKKGEVLVELANATQRQQVALAEAQLVVARAELERLKNGERAEKRMALKANASARRAVYQQLQKDWDRTRRVQRQHVASQEQADLAYCHVQRAKAELDQAKGEHALVEAPAREDEVAAAQGRVLAAEARLRLARAELAKTQLRAPTGGQVLRVYAEPGELAGPPGTSAQPILLFADLSRRRVRAFIEELDASRVKVGQSAVVTCDGRPGQEFRGTVREVLPRMGKRSLKTDAPEEYKDVFFREVLVELAKGADLLLNLQVRVQIQVR
jgi:multidrug resistance efflux pump